MPWMYDSWQDRFAHDSCLLSSCSEQACLEGADLHRTHQMPAAQVHILIILIVMTAVQTPS